MIKINLLPLQLRKSKPSPTRIPYIPLAILAGGLFFIMTLFFYTDFLRARAAYARVHKDWMRMNPLMGQLKAMENRVEIEMKAEKDFLEKNILNTDSITNILDSVSKYLPERGWLTELKAEREGEGCRLMLQGVVLQSRTRTGIELIEEYLNKLKANFPAGAKFILTTSKDSKTSDGVSFTANFEWGVVKKT